MEPIDTQIFGIVHRKQKINSKVKGNRNELRICTLLSFWTGHEFARVPMSGGLRWKNRMDICGDVINVDSTRSFPFSVEAKSYKNLGMPKTSRILRKNSIIYTFFSQCKRDAEAAKKIPFLIVRENQMPKNKHYIFLELNLEQLMKIMNYGLPDYVGDRDLCGFSSNEFFEKVSLETLKWIYERD